MGNTDIFLSRKDEQGNFGKPVNLGFPINTERSELALFVGSSGENAYFASARDSLISSLDIYSFKMPVQLRPDPVCYIKGIVFDSDTREKLEAEFKIIDLESEQIIYSSFSDSKTGKYLAAIPADKNYAINVSRKGYMFYSAYLPIKGIKSSSFVKDIDLNPIKVGKKIVLNNIFFDFDKSSIMSESEVELKLVIDFLKEYPNVQIEIGGHTDNKGSDDYNQDLSERRAKAVYDFIVAKGMIDPNRLSFKGYGETQAIESNDTDEGRALNRRTEFKITAI